MDVCWTDTHTLESRKARHAVVSRLSFEAGQAGLSLDSRESGQTVVTGGTGGTTASLLAGHSSETLKRSISYLYEFRLDRLDRCKTCPLKNNTQLSCVTFYAN